MPPTPITQSCEPLAISLYRFCHGSAGKRTPQPWCCCYHFVADDTVESLIHLRIYYQEGSYGIEGGKSATAATVPIILASKQLKNTFSKQGAYLKLI
jgi:hypothetical protein